MVERMPPDEDYLLNRVFPNLSGRRQGGAALMGMNPAADLTGFRCVIPDLFFKDHKAALQFTQDRDRDCRQYIRTYNIHRQIA